MEDVEPQHWGAHAWITEHTIVSALPQTLTKEIKEALSNRVYSMCHLTPCEKCRDHHNSFVGQFPPQFESALDAQTWWWKYHNYVNRLLGKAELSWDQLQKRFPVRGVYLNSDSKYAIDHTKTQLPVLTESTQHLTYPLVRAFVHQPRPQDQFIQKSVPKVLRYAQRQPQYGGTQWTQRTAQGFMNRSPFGRNQPQTQQWRSIMKQKSGAGQNARMIKKAGCSSCKKPIPN